MSVPMIALLAAATQAVLLVIVILAERTLDATWALITLILLLAGLLAALARIGFLRVDAPG
jgi:H+/Cl- antiporter ClcA